MRMDRKLGLLGSKPSLKELFKNSVTSVVGRNSSSSSSCRIDVNTYADSFNTKDYFISIFNGYIGIYEWDRVNLVPSTTPLFRSSTSYGGWYKSGNYVGYANSPGASTSTSVFAATLFWLRFTYSKNLVNQALENIAATRIAGANSYSNQYISYIPSNYFSNDIIILTLSNNLEIRDASIDTVIKSNTTGISALNGTTRYITGVNEGISTIYGGSIIGLTSN